MISKRSFVGIIVNVVIVSVLVTIALVGIGGGEVVAVSGNTAIYRGNDRNPNVSLMFNVYWGTEYVEDILKTLDAFDVKTTFFVGGSWVAKNTEVFKSIVDSGHEIGSHGYSHKDGEGLSYSQNVDEIMLTEKLLIELTGKKPTLFAPPSGSIGSNLFRACQDNNYAVIMWSRDTIDWRDKDCNTVIKRATSDIQNGELILMHPTAHTLKALPKVIGELKAKGFKITMVSEVIAPSKV
ncbi:MAG: polysaccharide deacetylase family protein [Clostridia bacterium]|nr:polysaccharide deacetylase family protein [Clostridia bacterium]